MENFNTDESFWIVHPALKLAGPFKELYTKDKSRNKAVSSKLAWSIKLIWNRKSEFYNLPEADKISLVLEDYYGDSTYYSKNKDKIDELRDFYLRITETVARRTLREIEEKLIERGQFIKQTAYTMGEIGERGQWVGGTADTLDKMMERTDKIYNLYDKAIKVVQQEEQSTVMGGAQESLTDSGEI